ATATRSDDFMDALGADQRAVDMTSRQRGHTGRCVARLQQNRFLVGVDPPRAQNHSGDRIGRRSDPADGQPFAPEIFRLDDIFAHDEYMFDAVDGDSDDFQVGDPGDSEIDHPRHFGLRADDITAGHGLDQNSAAIEIDALDVKTVFLPNLVALHYATQNVQRAG